MIYFFHTKNLQTLKKSNVSFVFSIFSLPFFLSKNKNVQNIDELPPEFTRYMVLISINSPLTYMTHQICL